MKTKSLASVMLYSCLHFFNLGMLFARCFLHKYNSLVFIMHTHYHACRAIKMTGLYTHELNTQSVVLLRACPALFYLITKGILVSVVCLIVKESLPPRTPGLISEEICFKMKPMSESITLLSHSKFPCRSGRG